MNNPLPQDHVYQLAATRKSGRSKAITFAARLSGLYRSADEGRTWKTSYGSLGLKESLPTLSVAVSPDFEHDPDVFAGLNGGILHSSDGGNHWESARLPSPPPTISALTISPNFAQDGTVFAATLEDGVLCSSDRGLRWSAWNFGLMDLNTYCIAISPDFASDETLFVGTQSGIFRSTNGGRAWREVNLPVGFEAVLSLAVSQDYAQDATLFAGTESRGLLRSTDGGLTWERLGRSKLKHPVNSILLAPGFPKQPEILILHGGSLLASMDDGQTWAPWQKETPGKKNITAVLAPRGLKPGIPILAGLSNGTIEPIK